MRLSNQRLRAAGRLAPVFAASLLALFSAGTAARGDYGDYDDSASQDYYEGSYGYLRVIDGTATLFEAGSGDREEAVVNQPVLIGDRLWTPPGSRVELVLSDRNLLRLDGDTEIYFDALAGSPDGNDSGTVLRLTRGNAQVVVPEDFLGADLPRLDLANATVYLREAGTYRVTADYDWAQVVVRQGSAEVLTQRGSVLVRRGEQAAVEGSDWVQTSVRAAGGLDTLERWGDELYERARRAEVRYVDPSLRYSSTTLRDNGEWIYVDSRPVWRPRVAVGWRPYYDGRWYPTPSGLTWVSTEPWGWVTYHYGTWDYAPHYGWVWYPGRYYSPAWVYWHWTPTYAAWCPVGYYTRYYYPRYRSHFGFGFHFGVYGWAGGHVGAYANWNFIETPHLAYRNQARYVRPGTALRAELGRNEVPRGIVTTDTRPITPQLLKRPQEVMAALETRPARTGRLPDVTGFIAKGDLGSEQLQAVAATRPRPGSADLTSNPMIPQVRPEGSSGASARLERKPAAVASGSSRGEATLSRRPAAAPDRGGAGGLSEPSRVAGARPRPGSDSGASLERRPAAVGSSRPADSGSALGRRPAERPGAADSGATLERRPIARPDDSRGGVSIQRRPATRPEVGRGSGSLERRPATGSDEDRGGSLDRRPIARPDSGGSGGASIDRRPIARPDSGGSGSLERRPVARPDSGGSGGASIERRPAERPSGAGGDRGTGRVESRPTRPRPDPPARPSTRPGSVSSRPAPSSSRPTYSRPSTSRPSSSGSGARAAAPAPSTSYRPGTRESRPEVSRPSSGSRSPVVSRPSPGSSSPQISRRPSSPRPGSVRPSSGARSSSSPRVGSSPPGSSPSGRSSASSSSGRSSGSRPSASSSGRSSGSRSSASSSSRSSGSRSSARSGSGRSGGRSARSSGRSGGGSRSDDGSDGA